MRRRTRPDRPDVVLFEPARTPSGPAGTLRLLDPAATEVIEALVGDLGDRGIPVVWVTHDLAQARRLAEHDLSFRLQDTTGDGLSEVASAFNNMGLCLTELERHDDATVAGNTQSQAGVRSTREVPQRYHAALGRPAKRL